MVPRRGTSQRCELRHLAAWAECVITRRQINVSIDRVGARHPRLQQFSPRLVAGSRQYPRVDEVELMAFLQRHHDWLADNDAELRTHLCEEHHLHTTFNTSNSNVNKIPYFRCRRLVQQRQREMLNYWLTCRAAEIREYAGCGEMKTSDETIKVVYNPQAMETASLLSQDGAILLTQSPGPRSAGPHTSRAS
nr:unnamed protein product [Spirometra erinaceieuropaei]